MLRFQISTELVVIPDPIIDCLRKYCALEKPLFELFKPEAMIKIINGPFIGLFGFFEKLQTLPNGLSRALILVEVLGSAKKLKIQMSQLKKLSA